MTRNIDYKIRISAALRRRLEAAARKRDVSINQEMAARLMESFERGGVIKLSKIAAGLESVYERFAREQRDHLNTQELIDAAEFLIKQLPPEMWNHEAVGRGITEVRKAVKAITDIHGRTYAHEPREK